MTTSLKSKSIEQLMAEADELVKKINSEFIKACGTAPNSLGSLF